MNHQPKTAKTIRGGGEIIVLNSRVVLTRQAMLNNWKW